LTFCLGRSFAATAPVRQRIIRRDDPVAAPFVPDSAGAGGAPPRVVAPAAMAHYIPVMIFRLPGAAQRPAPPVAPAITREALLTPP
jgi:hypothetical protein